MKKKTYTFEVFQAKYGRWKQRLDFGEFKTKRDATLRLCEFRFAYPNLKVRISA